MPASFPELYKADVLRAIETIELEKVGQAIDILIQARNQDRRIFVCGNGGKLGPMAQLNLQASNPHMGRIEDVHMIVMHMICYYFMDAEKPAAPGA